MNRLELREDGLSVCVLPKLPQTVWVTLTPLRVILLHPSIDVSIS